MTFVFSTITFNSHAVMAAQATAAQAADDQESEYTEEEFNAWEAADKEADPIKSGAMLIEFIKKYPATKLMQHAEYSYKTLLRKSSEDKKFQILETLAEQWNKIKPGNTETLFYIANAAEMLGHDDKCVQCMEELYKLNPQQGDMAYQIARMYKKMKNDSKYLQWTGIVLKLPEYEMDFRLRYELMQFYTENKDMVKAVELAKATLKSAELVKEPAADVKKTIIAIRHQANHLMGLTYYEQKKYDDAIKALQQAIKAEKYAEGYYWIGMCLWKKGLADDNQDLIDEAKILFAKAELMGGEFAPKAKENLELLHKKQHNNTTIGIDKVYKKAKETPDNF
jgi:tetratricopeptide (TPR) repeat protein